MITDRDYGFEALKRLLSAGEMPVYVGLQGEVAQIGAVHEYGLGGMPKRSFLASTLEVNQARYVRLLEDAINVAIDRQKSKVDTRPLGEAMRGDVRRRIDGNEIRPANDPAYRAQKGGKPVLVNTGRLRDSLVVKEKL